MTINISNAQAAKTFTIQKVDVTQGKEKIQNGLENNGKVDIVVADKSGTYHFSGEKIHLEELGQAAPEVAMKLNKYDENDDGFIEESELKHSESPSVVGNLVSSTVIGGTIGFVAGGIYSSPLGGILAPATGVIGGAVGLVVGAGIEGARALDWMDSAYEIGDYRWGSLDHIERFGPVYA